MEKFPCVSNFPVTPVGNTMLHHVHDIHVQQTHMYIPRPTYYHKHGHGGINIIIIMSTNLRTHLDAVEKGAHCYGDGLMGLSQLSLPKSEEGLPKIKLEFALQSKKVFSTINLYHLISQNGDNSIFT